MTRRFGPASPERRRDRPRRAGGETALPDDLTGDFFLSRKAQERTYLDEIERRFKRLPRVIVRQLPRDVYGTEPLTRVSEQLMAKASLEI